MKSVIYLLRLLIASACVLIALGVSLWRLILGDVTGAFMWLMVLGGLALSIAPGADQVATYEAWARENLDNEG
jgi:hypothetical protein